MSLPVRWGPMAMYNGVFPFGPDVRELEACLLNAQRTVQAFRNQIAENAKWSDLAAKQLIGLAEKNILITRERDNARAALAECQKLNATLREELLESKSALEVIVNREGELVAKLCCHRDEAKELREQLATVTAERDKAMAHIRKLNIAFTDVSLKDYVLRVNTERDHARRQRDALMGILDRCISTTGVKWVFDGITTKGKALSVELDKIKHEIEKEAK